MESHLEGLCRLLRPAVDLQVIVANSSRHTTAGIVDGVPVERLGSVLTLAGTSVCPGMAAAIRRHPADIVHIHLPNPTAVLAYLVSNHSGRLVFTYHSDIIRQKVLSALIQPMLDIAFRRARAIIATSPNYIEHSPVLRRFRDRCRVVPLGIDLPSFHHADCAAVDRIRRQYGPNLLLSVGRHVYYKGFEYLVRAMQHAPGKLLLIGNGPLRPQLESLIAALNLTDRVVLLGEVGDLLPYYHACDVFILPSIARSEAFGIVQMEAMACGKPVINTDLPSGVPFVSPAGVTGLCVPPADAARLAEAIRTLIGDPGLRSRLGAQARLRVENEFTLDVMVSRTLDLYRSILG